MSERQSTDSVRWVYGYGSTKHISADGRDVGLCGAHGGYPLIAEHRPVCKRCAKKFAQIDGSATDTEADQ